MSELNDEPVRRRLLPLLSSGFAATGGRSRMTCRYRCADACFHPVPNRSDNPYFGDVVEEGMSRRGLLKASAAAAFVVGAAPALAPAAAAAAPTARSGGGSGGAVAEGSALTFPTVEVNTVDTVIVPNGYDWSVLVVWGDPILPGAPAFDFDAQSEDAQERQFGYNNDFLALLPMRGNPDRALLWANHEYTNEELMFRGWTGAQEATAEQLRIAMAAHGGSIVEVERVGDTGEWRQTKPGRYNRRITARTPMEFTGPAVGSPHLRTSVSSGRHVRGTLNNCAGGVTPWGTILSGEENFNGYFDVAGTADGFPDYSGFTEEQATRFARYGVGSAAGTSFYRGWSRVEDRFDLAKEPNEPNRFGWVVQVDPWNRDSMPQKLTALGRMKHEGATTRFTADGRVAVYMGDDERFEYTYKFISRRRFRNGSSAAARAWNMRLLDEGDLYVAQYTGDSPDLGTDGMLPADGKFDGTGRWLPLVVDGKSMVEGMSVDEVLVFTRIAADLAGATKMDRPEDFEPNPVTGKIYVALTNNTKRTVEQVDEANPRFENKHGHIIEITERGNDSGSTTFRWEIFLMAGDPEDPTTYFAGADKSKVSPISAPDNVAFDPAGNLWITTDGNALGFNDGLFATPVRGEERGVVRQFMSTPDGAECTGPVITDDARTVLVAVQHPGEGDGASPDNPISTFPYGGQPRPTVVSVWRKAPGSKRVGA